MQQRIERKDAARHREIILDTASQLFHEHGVEGVSMHQIAKSAGVGQGTLYRRYASKAELCLELLTDTFDRYTTSVEQYLAESADLTARARMEGFLSLMIDFFTSEMEWLNAIKPTATCTEERMTVFQSEPFVYVTNKFKSLLDDAINNGEARPFDTEFAAFTAAATFDPGIFFHLTKECGYSLAQIKEKYIRYYDGLFLN